MIHEILILVIEAIIQVAAQIVSVLVQTRVVSVPVKDDVSEITDDEWMQNQMSTLIGCVCGLVLFLIGLIGGAFYWPLLILILPGIYLMVYFWTKVSQYGDEPPSIR